MNKRVLEIDTIKGISIILVIIGHAQVATWINIIIYSFHMPIFYFVSGLLYKEGVSLNKRAKSLMIPFYIASSLSYIFWIFKQYYYKFDGIPLYGPIIGTLYGSNIDGFLQHNLPIWFLPSLFSIYVLTSIVKLNRINIFLLLIFSFLFMNIMEFSGETIILPLSLSQGIIGLFFFLIGYMMKGYDFYKLRFIKYNIKTLVLFVFITLVICSIFNGRVDIQSLVFSNPVLFVLNAILGIVLLLLIVYSFNNNNKVFLLFGKYSLHIFITQIILMIILKGVFLKLLLPISSLVLIALQITIYYIYFEYLHARILKIIVRQ